MKRFLLFLILAIISTPCYSKNFEDEFATDEIRNTKQKDEVLLNTDSVEQDNFQTVSDLTQLDFMGNDGEEEDISTQENSQEDFKLFEFMGKKDKNHIEESILKRLYTKNNTRTDVPIFLLQEELTFEPKGTFLKEVQVFGGYRGGVSADINRDKFSPKYNNFTTEVGILARSKDEKFDFKLSFLPVPTHHKNYLDTLFSDIFIGNTSIPHHKIIVGFSRVQTGMEGGAGAYTLPFVNRSQIARTFGSVRSLGAKISGNYKYTDYSLAFGSSSRSFVRGMPGTEFTGWVNFKPFSNVENKLGRLTVGAGINSGHNRINYTVGSFYVGYKYKKLWTNFETSIANGYNGGGGISSDKASGWAYTAGWKFNPHLQLIGRIDQFDPNRNLHGDLKREYTAGLNWFIKGQTLKFVLNYIFCDNQNIPDSHKVILSTQILL